MSTEQVSAVHAYFPPQFDDSRSPCPALNALANHSYLPHNGKRISFLAAVRALHAVYHVSWVLAALLTLGACVCGGGIFFSLADLRKHNIVEHDGSLSRPDAPEGAAFASIAPAEPDPARLKSLLGAASAKGGDEMSLDDLCRVRAARDAALAKPLDFLHSRIAVGEVALAFLTFSHGARDGSVPVAALRTWFGHDRLPDDFVPPAKYTGFIDMQEMTDDINRRIAALPKNK